MINSMTAFASRSGDLGEVRWAWDIRCVNGRGFDVRIRMPDGFEKLEMSVRKALKTVLSRGTVTASLTVHAGSDAMRPLQMDDTRLTTVLQALDHIQDRAFELGVTLGQPTAADVLDKVAGRGSTHLAPDPDLFAALTTDLGPLLSDLTTMRAAEGQALQTHIADFLQEAQDLIRQADGLVVARKADTRRALRDAYARIMSEVTDVDNERLMQELAVLSLKQDVTEELDRLRNHIAAAWDAMDQDEPVGRRLDFIAQEMMREANTLCAKSQNADLSALGIDLKIVIDRLREQAQNVE